MLVIKLHESGNLLQNENKATGLLNLFQIYRNTNSICLQFVAILFLMFVLKPFCFQFTSITGICLRKYFEIICNK